MNHNEYELLIELARARIALQHIYIEHMRNILSQGADVDEYICSRLIEGTTELENLILTISSIAQRTRLDGSSPTK